MCGAYGYSVKDAREIYDRFGVLNKLEAYKPRWNVRIAQMAPVIYMTADGVQIKEMYWSFIPSWGFLHIPSHPACAMRGVMPHLGSCRVVTSTPFAKQSGRWVPVFPTRHDLDMRSFSFSTQSLRKRRSTCSNRPLYEWVSLPGCGGVR
jgi:putative SOS response-associated peptidase YedK